MLECHPGAAASSFDQHVAAAVDDVVVGHRGDELRHPLDTPVDLADSHAEVVDGISGLHAHPVVRTDDLPARSTD